MSLNISVYFRCIKLCGFSISPRYCRIDGKTTPHTIDMRPSKLRLELHSDWCNTL